MRSNSKYRARKRRDDGVTLLAVMMLLTVLSIIAVGAFNVSIMEGRMVNNYTRVIANEPQAMADAIDAFRAIQKTTKYGSYDRWTINLANIPDHTGEYGTVSIRPLKVQDLIDESITTAASIAGTATFPDTSTSAYVYFGYSPLSNPGGSSPTFSTNLGYYTTTASGGEANLLPVLVMTTSGDSDSNMPGIEAWVAPNPGLPILAELMAGGTVYYNDWTMWGGSKHGVENLKLYNTEFDQCGGLLANMEEPYASLSVQAYLASQNTIVANTNASQKKEYYDHQDLQGNDGIQIISSATFNNLINVDAFVDAIAASQWVAPESTAVFPRTISGTYAGLLPGGNGGLTDFDVFYAPSVVSIQYQATGLLAAEKTVHIDGGTMYGLVITKSDLIIDNGKMIGPAIAGGDIYVDPGADVRVQGCQAAVALGNLPPKIIHISR